MAATNVRLRQSPARHPTNAEAGSARHPTDETQTRERRRLSAPPLSESVGLPCEPGRSPFIPAPPPQTHFLRARTLVVVALVEAAAVVAAVVEVTIVEVAAHPAPL